MPKDIKTLGNNKARAWESLGFAHKKKLCQHFDTTSLIYSDRASVSSQQSLRFISFFSGHFLRHCGSCLSAFPDGNASPHVERGISSCWKVSF